MDIGIKDVLGLLICELRKNQKISQSELAERSGMHINTIHLLESGKNEPKISTLFFVAKGLNVGIEEFISLLSKKYYGK